MASIKIKFRPSTKDGKVGVLYFQVIHKRVVRQIITPHHVATNEWEAIAPTVLDNEHRLLCHIIARFDKTGETYSADSIVNEYNRLSKNLTFSAFMKNIITQLQQNKQHCTARNYQSTLNSFMRFRNNVDIALDCLDATLVQSYEVWLKNTSVCRNTSSFYMRILRAVYNRAVENNLISQQYPFRRIYTGIDKTRKRSVGLDTIKAIKQADLKGNASLNFARDMFIMSFCLRGMSFVDLAKLRKTDIRDGYLHYTRSKTHQSLCVKWEPMMQEMADKYKPQVESSEYLFPILSDDGVYYNKVYRNAQMRIGYHLKNMAKTLGLKENLTLYVARHSWASIARDCNIPISVISEALGHDSERTTQIYLQSIQTSEVDKANASILGKL